MANWGVYNATANTYIAGTALGASFGAGAHAIQISDGSFLVFAGGASSSHWIFNSGLPLNLAWSAINPISSAPTVTTGAFSIRRPDGKFLIIPGAINSSSIYDPRPTTAAPFGSFTAQSAVGRGPTLALNDAAQAIWRQDGKFLMLEGSGSTVTNIIDPSREDANQFVTGPVLSSTPGAGVHMFMDARGLFRIIMGNVTQTTSTYDTGYIRGGPSSSTGAIYESECITTALHSGSTLTWKTNADDILMKFQVKTGNGACSGSYKEIRERGDLIRATSGHNRVQIKVIFERSAPSFSHQDWGLRRGIGQTQYRRMMNDPALYEVSIRNTAQLHRTQFDFGNSNDASGPLAVNLVNNRNKNLQIQLANMVTYASTINATNSNIYNGAFTTHTVNSRITNIGTVVMKRPDGKFVIISGSASGATAVARLYDPLKQTFNPLGVAPTMATSTGAVAFKRPDGQFLIVMGGNRVNTNLYDPVNNTFTEGPVMQGRVAEGANVIPMPNGQMLILHGGFQRTASLYNPITNTIGSGATSTLRIGRGSIVIPRPDGRYLIIPGTSSHLCALQTATMMFDPYANQFLPNPGVAITTGTGPGAFAFERSDGQWMIIKGGATLNSCASINTTNIYNPFTNRMLVGPTTTATSARYGAQAMQRPDGSYQILYGGGATATMIYYEKSGAWTAEGFPGPIGTFVAGATLPTATGTGSVVFQRDDGKYVILGGQIAFASAGTNSVMQYDSGWVIEGFYRSEAINVPDLDSNSTLSWDAPDYNGISAQVRTGTSALTMTKGSEREVSGPGGKIHPNTGDTWVQVQFSFRRTFPGFPGAFEDVWWNGGTTPAVRFRDVKSPTITEFSVGKDTDLINLRADKNSLFRVNSNGDIYTGLKGSLYAGGADLAERYHSTDNLTPGEVVIFDYSLDHAVRRSMTPYQSELLGIVSTDPGFIAGAFTKNAFPIALVGRVPVNVSLENGPIRAGDRLTSASLPGFAMKATRAGRVIGVALEGSKPETFKTCKADPTKQCGQIMIFVNLTDWYGPETGKK